MTEAPAVETRAIRSKRWGFERWLLVGSLAFNVLVFGTVAGSLLRGAIWGHPTRGAPTNIIGYVMSLPGERRSELMKRASAARPELRLLRQQVRAAGRDRTAALLAEPFDRQRYLEAQVRQFEAERQLRALLGHIVAETAARMSLEERRAFVSSRGSRRGGGSDDVDPDAPPAKRP